MVTRRQQQSAQPLNLRLTPELRKRIESIQDLYITGMNAPGFSFGPVKEIKKSQILRWALELGLDAIEAKVREQVRKHRGGK